MSLIDLMCYLQQVPMATLANLVTHFRTKPALLEGMLHVLIDQEKVVCYQSQSQCGKSCADCPIAQKTAPFYAASSGRCSNSLLIPVVSQ